jgi:hypothetical protein
MLISRVVKRCVFDLQAVAFLYRYFFFVLFITSEEPVDPVERMEVNRPQEPVILDLLVQFEAEV